MRAVSGTFGVEEGAVRAVAAGADALCLGHDLGKRRRGARAARARCRRARRGGSTEERLAQAAERVAGVARWTLGAHAGTAAPREVGLEAARRAIRVEGDVALTRPPRVIELSPSRRSLPGRHATASASSSRSAGRRPRRSSCTSRPRTPPPRTARGSSSSSSATPTATRGSGRLRRRCWPRCGARSSSTSVSPCGGPAAPKATSSRTEPGGRTSPPPPSGSAHRRLDVIQRPS